MNSQVWWFVARSSGIIAWALLTLAVVWGLLLSTKVSSTRIAARRLRPAWLLDLHRHLGALAVIFTAIHIIGIVADSYVTFSWSDVLIPMASDWKPGPVAFGVVSMYLLLAIEGTSLAIRYLPRPVWRWVHRASFVLFGVATYHGITSGTDAGNLWFRLASWIAIGVVVALTIRLLIVLRRRPSVARAGGDVAVADSDDASANGDVPSLDPPAPALLPPPVSSPAPFGPQAPTAPVPTPPIFTPPTLSPPVAAPAVAAPAVPAPAVLAPPVPRELVGAGAPVPPPPPIPAILAGRAMAPPPRTPAVAYVVTDG
jgi:DMSO/TMAO reductase YedYZ heme-binding membrane subunit